MAWDLSYITKKVEEQAVEHAQDIALEMYREINELSPVKTSRYVSNWYIAVGYTPERYDGDRKIGRDLAYFDNGRDEVLAMKKLDNIWMLNETPYGGDLELGNSRQAPEGVVRVVFPAVARKHGY